MSDTENDLSHLREHPLRRRTVYEGRLLHVFEDVVALPSGREARREVVEHPGAVAVVAITAEGRAVLVRQWRHAVGRALWELCAGTREPGEDPLACAQRELQEETGFTAESWRPLMHGPCSPGMSSEIVHLFVAEGLRAGRAGPDPDETLDVGFFDRGEVQDLLHAGETDLKTAAGLSVSGWLGAPGGGWPAPPGAP